MRQAERYFNGLLTSKANVGSMSRAEVRDFIESLSSIAEHRLPDVKNISHDGFKIALKAHILAARQSFDAPSNEDWDLLYGQANNIPNVSDKCVVQTMIASLAPSRMRREIERWLACSRADLANIPAAGDRVERYRWMAEILSHNHRAISKDILREGMSLAVNIGSIDDSTEMQKAILDLAHNVDPALVKELVELSDTDEARRFAKNELSERVRHFENKNKIAKDPKLAGLRFSSEADVSEICFDHLGSLMAGRLPSRPIEEFCDLIEFGADRPVEQSFPIWAFIIENAIRNNSRKKDVGADLPNLFESVMSVGELSATLLRRSSSANPIIFDSADQLIRYGDRDVLLIRLKEWARGVGEGVIHISDPFFGPEELIFVMALHEAAPRAVFKILTSKHHIRRMIKGSSPEDSFQIGWREICDAPPPLTEIIIVSHGPDEGHPIHDRWILSDESGLRLGGSLNGMGLIKTSEISTIDRDEVVSRRMELDCYCGRQRRELNGEKITYSLFELS